VTFTDLSYNGTPTSWAWSFPGGTPSTDNSPNPTITYNTPGIYDVTLTVSNSSGSVTATKSGYIVVNPTTAMVSAPMFEESFESGTPIPNSLWRVKNGMTGTNTWEQTTVAAATGTNSVRIINTTASDGQEDELIGPSIDMTALTGSAAVMTFKVAHAQKTSTSADKLQVYVSTTCGETWSLRKVLSGAALSTAGVQSTSFTPTASQWVTQSVNLSSYAGQPNLYFMFRFTSDGGNNVYIDDINILANVGVEDMESALNMNVFPNPADGTAFISFDMVERADVTVELTDLVGRKISSVYSGELSAGEQKFEIAEAGSLTAGMYLVTLNVDGHTFTKKLMVH
jgi:PKD repeat protein